jgi:hypothetical protein
MRGLGPERGSARWGAAAAWSPLGGRDRHGFADPRPGDDSGGEDPEPGEAGRHRQESRRLIGIVQVRCAVVVLDEAVVEQHLVGLAPAFVAKRRRLWPRAVDGGWRGIGRGRWDRLEVARGGCPGSVRRTCPLFDATRRCHRAPTCHQIVPRTVTKLCPAQSPADSSPGWNRCHARRSSDRAPAGRSPR